MSDEKIEGKLQVTEKVGIGSSSGAERPEVELHISQGNKESKICVASGGNVLQVAAEDKRAFMGTIGNRPLDIQTNEISRIFISEDGLVGIGGKTNPTFKLDVQGTINATQFNKNGQPWKITNGDIDDNTISGLKIQDNSIPIGKLKDFSPSPGSQWKDGSSGSGSIFYDGSGNVGIGIGKTNPTFKLDVQGTINATQFNKNGQPWKITNDDIDDNAAIDGNKMKDGSIPIKKIKDLPPSTSSQWVSGNSGIISYSGGNVGIGISNPQFKLDVQGIINATQFYKNGVPWIISRDEIANQAINADKIGNGAVTTDKIANKSITQEKLAFQISPGSSQWQGVDGDPISYTKANVGIGTNTPLAKLQVANGAIMPSAGNSETAGIMFPKDPFGGNGDAAWMRYYARTDEACTLEIGISNDGDDHIALMASGNVGIGTNTPSGKLHIYEPTDDEGQGGSIKFFDTGANWKYEISYDGGSDGKFMFTNTGKAEGETGFQSSATGKLLTIKNNGQVEVSSGNLLVQGKMVQASSRELKENITDFSTQEAIKTLAGLNPVKFNYRGDKEKELTVGFIAEDVPDLLATHDKKGVCALEIVALLTKVIKEQQMELSLLRQRVTALEGKA